MPTTSTTSCPDDLHIRFFRDVLRINPDHEEALYLTAAAYQRQGRYRRCLIMRRRLARLRPQDSWVAYKLASSYALTRDREIALDTLVHAAALGFRDIRFLMGDRSFDFIRTDSRFHRILTWLRLQDRTPRPILIR